MSMSEKIKYLRNEVMKLKQKELAGLIGVSVSTLKKWEKGDTKPNVNHLIMLSLRCDASLQFLVYENHPEELSQIGLTDIEYNAISTVIECFRIKNKEEGIYCE